MAAKAEAKKKAMADNPEAFAPKPKPVGQMSLAE